MEDRPSLEILRCTLEEFRGEPLNSLDQLWDGGELAGALQWSWGIVEGGMCIRARWLKPVFAARGSKGVFQAELWRGDVLELFFGLRGETSYYEFNFSPSGGWWAAKYSDYRLPDATWANLFRADCAVEESSSHIDVSWFVQPLPVELLRFSDLLANVTGCKVNTNSEMSYLTWNPAPTGVPDFHLVSLRRSVDLKAA